MNERELIAWLRRRAAELSPSGEAGGLIGDDTAFLPAGGPWAVTVDSQIEGVHFLPGLDPAVVARRLLAVNLSDLAAVGGRPRYAFLALSAPAGYDRRPFLEALLEACSEHGMALAGGDLSRQEHVAGTLTLLGDLPPAPEEAEPGAGQPRWVRRDAGRPGDVLWLGGTVGESAAGRILLARGARLGEAAAGGKIREEPPVELPRRLTARLANEPGLAGAARRAVRRHLAPEPQLALGVWLGRRERAAALDVSDGVALDAARLAEASGVGARLDPERFPASPSFSALARALDEDAESLALSGGEDYVLLFALPPGEEPPGELAPEGGFRSIGELARKPGLWRVKEGGDVPLEAGGWDHLSKEGNSSPKQLAK